MPKADASASAPDKVDTVATIVLTAEVGGELGFHVLGFFGARVEVFLLATKEKEAAQDQAECSNTVHILVFLVNEFLKIATGLVGWQIYSINSPLNMGMWSLPFGGKAGPFGQRVLGAAGPIRRKGGFVLAIGFDF